MMSKTLKVAIIGCVGVPAKYGGFETLAEKLVTHLSAKVKLTVYCSELEYSKRIKEYKGASLEYISLSANGIQSVFYDIISIKRAIKNHDVLLILGVAGAMALPFLKFNNKAKIIVHIDGLEWKRDKWKWFAKLYLKWSEKIAFYAADRIIADNKEILQCISRRFQRKTRMIAYGGSHVRKMPLKEQLLSKYRIRKEPYVFSVCRIVPENNIGTILNALKETGDYIVFVGNWYDSNYGIDLWREYHELPNIELIHPIYNEEELDALRSNCKLYIHGHSAGGTNPSLVEAMYLGLPILCFDVNFNRYTLGGTGYFFHDQKSLENLLRRDLDVKVSLDHKDYALKHYNWENISNQYLNLFNEV